jgi:hypothetical protein
VHLQQQLTTCEVCSAALAIEYQGYHRRLADTRINVGFFPCPACHHENPQFVPFGAGPFAVKVIPGPEVPGRVHANTVRLWLAAGLRARETARVSAAGRARSARARLRQVVRGVMAGTADPLRWTLVVYAPYLPWWIGPNP